LLRLQHPGNERVSAEPFGTKRSLPFALSRVVPFNPRNP
jgi:hypothetical protein